MHQVEIVFVRDLGMPPDDIIITEKRNRCGGQYTKTNLGRQVAVLAGVLSKYKTIKILIHELLHACYDETDKCLFNLEVRRNIKKHLVTNEIKDIAERTKRYIPSHQEEEFYVRAVTKLILLRRKPLFLKPTLAQVKTYLRHNFNKQDRRGKDYINSTLKLLE